MYPIVIVTTLLIICAFFAFFNPKRVKVGRVRNFLWHLKDICIPALSALIFSTLVVVLYFTAEYWQNKATIQEFKEFKRVIEVTRQDSNVELERTALIYKIVDWNTWLTRKKWWNNSNWLDFAIPDEIEQLEPIK